MGHNFENLAISNPMPSSYHVPGEEESTLKGGHALDVAEETLSNGSRLDIGCSSLSAL
jgi:hypothetical protein